MVAGMAYTRVFTRSIKRPTFNYGFKLGFCTGSASAATMLRPLIAIRSSVRKLTLTRALAGSHGGSTPPIHIPQPSKKHVETGGSDVPQPTLYTDPEHVHNPGPPVTLDLMPVPQYCYYDTYTQLNRKFNGMLAVSAVFLLGAFGMAYYTDTFCFAQTSRAPASYYKRTSPSVAVPEKPKDDDVPPPEPELEFEQQQIKKVVQEEKTLIDVPAFHGLETVPYLLIGGGTASYYAALGIRARDAEAKVVIVGDESELPYNRPPLTKELWWYGDDKVSETLEYKGLTGKPRDVYYESSGFYVKPEELVKCEHGAVSLVKGKKVVQLDIPSHTAVLDDGMKIRYGKCLIATGSTPKTLPALEGVRDKTILYKSIADFQHLDKLAQKHDATIAVVGSGLLGSELAHSLNKRYKSKGLRVVQIAESGVLADLLPKFLADKTTEEMRKSGVVVYSKGHVEKADKTESGKARLTLSSGEVVVADAVVVDAGSEPNVALGSEAGIAIDEKNGGLIADAYLKAAEDVWVAGDVCSYDDPILGRRRYNQYEHSQALGRQAGENMTGGSRTLPHRGAFFSIIGADAHFNAVGDIDSKLPTVSIFAEPKGGSDELKGVVFYQNEQKVVGVVMYNVFGNSVSVARRIIADQKDLSAEELKDVAKLFDLYGSAAEDSEEKREEK
ncbi:hypothetical protein QR680_013986 [Steinernema hermaphroditum]|uniref:Apoptosis-inducing factor 1, mitochondrial n=1 Tax=Steinernema hermaphroditum TaxID=289476 RepID=A0AA39M2G4_9BILA|nr:hypothetical protein QR680_013986 [Steinernema hermaphroditum]